MRKKMIMALVLAAMALASQSFAETTNQGYEDEGLTFSIQTKQGAPWTSLKSHMNSASRACVYGNPRCLLQKGRACQPYAMKIEGPGGVHELKCLASHAERSEADRDQVQNNYNRAQNAAKGQ